uniref:Pre-mRNA polyadenylation factor Fip1 domain-containing protein n=1 Tax=Strigamia maritima TaxID=126957 RepID=T1JB43_STRMM
MAATGAIDDDENWLYGESNQEDKRPDESEEVEEVNFAESINEVVHLDEESRTSRYSNDSGTTGLEEIQEIRDRDHDHDQEREQEQEDQSDQEGQLRPFDDKEAGELSGEEDGSLAAPMLPSEEGGRERGSDDSDSDDDSVQVTIGDIKAAPSYGYAGPPVNLNIKRGYSQGGPGGQSSKTKGVDLDSVGMINGVPTYEFNLDSMEDKPWRKPGADITDYFNYGFNEDTWKAYCEKQRKLRLEAAGGSPAGLAAAKPHHTGGVMKKAGPPPGRKTSGSIDVIGASTTTSRRPIIQSPKENVIQVMTADKREYSRKPNAPPFDTTMPPPPPGIVPPLGLGVFPPDLAMPPPGLPPGFPPPGLPPPNLPLPPPNYGDSFDGYNRNYPPPPGSGPGDRLPGFDNSYDGNYYNSGNGGSNPGSTQDVYNPYEPTGEGWDGRDNPGSRFSQSRSPPNDDDYDRRHRDYRDRERSRDRDRDRDRERDRDRDRERHRDRDRDRDRDREREYEGEERRDGERRHREHRDRDDKHSRSSRRKHRTEEDDSSDHRSSRHKRKRSKRDKDDDMRAESEAKESVSEIPQEDADQDMEFILPKQKSKNKMNPKIADNSNEKFFYRFRSGAHRRSVITNAIIIRKMPVEEINLDDDHTVVLKVAVGIGFLVLGGLDINVESQHRVSNILNNVLTIGIFIITVLNVLTSAFGMKQISDDNDIDMILSPGGKHTSFLEASVVMDAEDEVEVQTSPWDRRSEL